LPAQLGALVATRRGRFDEAHRLLAVADDLSRGMSDVQVRGSFHMMVAELALLEGRPGDAYADIERALALAAATDDESTRTETFAMAARSLAGELAAARPRGRASGAGMAREPGPRRSPARRATRAARSTGPYRPCRHRRHRHRGRLDCRGRPRSDRPRGRSADSPGRRSD